MSLPAGDPDHSAIAEPVIVHAGQMSRSGQQRRCELSVNATADQAGRVGDTILMTNASTGQRFTRWSRQGVELRLD